MKTSFNVAWVDDNLADPEMDLTSQLERKLRRKNGFTLNVNDVYAEASGGDFDDLLSNLSNTIDLSNSIDLVVVDFQLGGNKSGEKIAKKFRDTLPSVDIVFYSGKESAEDLRLILAKENVDNVNCVGRTNLVEGTYTIIENVINRSHKISTLRGLILNSVCEIDDMIIQILCKFSSINSTQESTVKDEAVEQIAGRANSSAQARIKRRAINDLLEDKAMMSGKLFSILYNLRNSLNLSQSQLTLLGTYRTDILDLRTSAAHAKEGICSTSNKSMLENKRSGFLYKRDNIDQICHTIVRHENNIKSILSSMV